MSCPTKRQAQLLYLSMPRYYEPFKNITHLKSYNIGKATKIPIMMNIRPLIFINIQSFPLNNVLTLDRTTIPLGLLYNANAMIYIFSITRHHSMCSLTFSLFTFLLNIHCLFKNIIRQ